MLKAEVLPEVDDSLISKLSIFLLENPNPPDSAVHAWAEKAGLPTDKVEAAIYTLATKHATLMHDGLAGASDFTEDDADPRELSSGVEVEMEHTTDPAIAKKIALDHLAEIPDYYSRLSRMESQARSDANNS
jgi:hypothetical protein